MKTFVCVLLMAAAVTAEPPLFRQQNRFQRQQLDVEINLGDNNSSAPYPAAGFKPAQEFNLPSRQEFAPSSSYGAPLAAVVNSEYGVPDAYKVESTAEKADTEEDKKENLGEAPKSDAEVVSSQGAYYVLLPGSQLQRVQFQTENDLANMAYTARLQYRNEDRAPLYVYSAVPQYQPTAAYVQLY